MDNTPYKYSRLPDNEFLEQFTADFKETLDKEILELPMLEERYIREYPNNSITKLRQ